MEKFNFIRDEGSTKLPPGFVFQPTDEELVFQYLARKTFSHPLPAMVIPEIDVFNFDPWELPGDSSQDKYFFSNKETNRRSVKRADRATCGGFWKASGLGKRVVWSRTMPVVGIKRTLVFHKVKRCGVIKTDWIMNMYCIALSGHSTHCTHQRQNFQASILLGKWILCHVFQNKMNIRGEICNVGEDINNDISNDIDSSSSASSSTSSSSFDSNSSILSEVSSNSMGCNN